jgi:hypothetical protein
MRTLLIAIAALFLSASPALAIVDGEPDEGRHPSAGLLAYEVAGQHYVSCSGFYAGPQRDDPTRSVFVTAAHCLADFGVETLRVTFEEHVDQSEEGFPDLPVWAASWRPAVASVLAAQGDYGVVLLQGAVDAPAIGLPAARRLNDLAARGRLRPTTRFDNVGYGVDVVDGEFRFPDRRTYSESKYLGLTQTTMKLLANEDAGPGYGGVCYFDSGGPVLEHGTQNAVALIGGKGDPNCRAKFDPPRLDIPQARAFYGQYLDLP